MSEEKKQERYLPYRVPRGTAFCLEAGLKILALKRATRRNSEESRGIYRLSEARQLLGNLEEIQ